jgi:hypothetical protein
MGPIFQKCIQAELDQNGCAAAGLAFFDNHTATKAYR